MQMGSITETALGKYEEIYKETRDNYRAAMENLKKAAPPYKAARDAYVAATARFTKDMYE